MPPSTLARFRPVVHTTNCEHAMVLGPTQGRATMMYAAELQDTGLFRSVTTCDAPSTLTLPPASEGGAVLVVVGGLDAAAADALHAKLGLFLKACTAERFVRACARIPRDAAWVIVLEPQRTADGHRIRGFYRFASSLPLRTFARR